MEEPLISKETTNVNGYEVNKVTYSRTGGKENDEVNQIKKGGTEVGHKTIHPDGKINIHGDYEKAMDEISR